MQPQNRDLELLRNELARGDRSPRGLQENCQEAIARQDDELRALAWAEAGASRQRAQDLEQQGFSDDRPLWGLPYVAQDDLCVQGVPAAYGSTFLESYRPPFSATVLKRVEEAGAVRMGKAAVPEFALGENPRGTAHPEREGHAAGVGADGAAVAVAAGMAAFALGGDIGGSLRTAASFCRLSCLKPTHGRVSRNGLISVASSLEQVGVVAPTPRDCGQVLAACAGWDPADGTSAAGEWQLPPGGASLSDLSVGLVTGQETGVLSPEAAEALEAACRGLEKQGVRVQEAQLDHLALAGTATLAIAWAEASSELANLDGVRFGRQEAANHLQEMYRRSRARGLGPGVKALVVGGTALLTEELGLETYQQATRVRTLLLEELKRLASRYDLLLLPSTPGTAPRAEEAAPGALFQARQWAFTSLASLSGYPALSVPWPEGSAPGTAVQLTASPWREDLLVGAGQELLA